MGASTYSPVIGAGEDHRIYSTGNQMPPPAATPFGLQVETIAQIATAPSSVEYMRITVPEGTPGLPVWFWVYDSSVGPGDKKFDPRTLFTVLGPVRVAGDSTEWKPGVHQGRTVRRRSSHCEYEVYTGQGFANGILVVSSGSAAVLLPDGPKAHFFASLTVWQD